MKRLNLYLVLGALLLTLVAGFLPWMHNPSISESGFSQILGAPVWGMLLWSALLTGTIWIGGQKLNWLRWLFLGILLFLLFHQFKTAIRNPLAAPGPGLYLLLPAWLAQTTAVLRLQVFKRL